MGYAAVVEILCAALQSNGWGEQLADSYLDKNGKKPVAQVFWGTSLSLLTLSLSQVLRAFVTYAAKFCQAFEIRRKTQLDLEEFILLESRARGVVAPVTTAGLPCTPLQQGMLSLRDNFEDEELKTKYAKLPFE